MVESNLFLLAIIDAYAFMVWPFMGLGAKREIYSGYEPSWIYAHAAPYWIQEMQEEKILPAAKDLLKDGGVDETFGYVSEEEISDLFNWLVPQTMAHHNMKAVIDTAKEFRCFEDFDYRNSRQKIDFYRKWYHTRAKNVTVESLEEIKKYIFFMWLRPAVASFLSLAAFFSKKLDNIRFILYNQIEITKKVRWTK